MCIFLCFRKKQKKNKHNDILMYHYINCKYCNSKFAINADLPTNNSASSASIGRVEKGFARM